MMIPVHIQRLNDYISEQQQLMEFSSQKSNSFFLYVLDIFQMIFKHSSAALSDIKSGLAPPIAQNAVIIALLKVMSCCLRERGIERQAEACVFL